MIFLFFLYGGKPGMWNAYRKVIIPENAILTKMKGGKNLGVSWMSCLYCDLKINKFFFSSSCGSNFPQIVNSD